MFKKIIGLTGMMLAFLLSSYVPVMAGTDDKKGTDGKNFPSLLGNSEDAPFLKHQSDSLYDIMGLGNYGLERNVFYTAYKGYQFLLKNGSVRIKNILTVCDYSQSSNNKRLYVINLAEGRLLYNTFVSHGKNSGGEFATSFSNLKSSNKSSLGFMLTAETYRGVAGYSMRFDGLEKGINDKVRSRDIVLHGSYYVNDNTVEERGVIGNSLGCPAVPLALHKKIIDAIKGGSCFFINHPDSWYTHTSTIINSKFDIAPNVLIAAGNQQAAPQATANASATKTADGGL